MIYIPTFRPVLKFIPTVASFFPAATADMLLWLNASSIVAVNGSSITSWRDDGPSHRTVTSSVTVVANQPKYVTNSINGQPAVFFGTTSLQLAPFPTASAQSSSAEFWAVFKTQLDPTVTNTHEGPVFMRSSSLGAEAVPFTDGRLYESFYNAQTTNTHTAISKSVLLTTPTLYNVLSENNHMAIYHRGEIIYSTDDNVVPPGGAWGTISHSIGTGDPGAGAVWPGYISEIIVYGRKLTTAERITTNNYFVNKYAVDCNIDSASINPRTYDLSGTSSLKGWWDANNITGSNSSSISSWPDMSGNGNNLTQSIANKQPVLFTSVYAGGTAATVRFTSSVYNFGTVSPFVQTTNAPFTFFAVCKATAADSNILGHDVQNVQFRIRRGNTNQINFFPQANELIASFPKAVGSYQLNVWTRASGSGVVGLWQNALKASAPGTAGGAFTWNLVGDGPFGIPFIGDIGELVWFNYVLSDYSIFKLYDIYFRPKWGLPGG